MAKTVIQKTFPLNTIDLVRNVLEDNPGMQEYEAHDAVIKCCKAKRLTISCDEKTIFVDVNLVMNFKD